MTGRTGPNVSSVMIFMRVIDLRQDGGREEVARQAFNPPSSAQDFRPSFHRLPDMLLDDLELAGVLHRPDVHAGVQGIAHAQLCRDFHHPSDKSRRDFLSDINALDRGAALAGVHEGGPDRPERRLLDIGIAEDDHRVLAPELKHHVGQVVAGELQDPLADADAAR